MNRQKIKTHVSGLSSEARADIAAGRWDEVMTDALYRACDATTPDEMTEARALAATTTPRAEPAPTPAKLISSSGCKFYNHA